MTLFGHDTCRELFASMRAIMPQVELNNLYDARGVESALRKAGFVDSRVSSEVINVEFRDCMELLTWLKAIGANQLSEHPVFLGKNALQETEKYYRKHYPYHEGICASFEVIWVYAIK